MSGSDKKETFRLRDDELYVTVEYFIDIDKAVYEVDVGIPNNIDLTNNYKDMKNTVTGL